MSLSKADDVDRMSEAGKSDHYSWNGDLKVIIKDFKVRVCKMCGACSNHRNPLRVSVLFEFDDDEMEADDSCSFGGWHPWSH